jgi:anti-sigma factor RsiW
MTSIHPNDPDSPDSQDSVVLGDYVDNALAPAERARVEAHLAECAECRELVAGLRSVVATAAALAPLDPPRAAWSRIERGIRAEGAGRRTPRWPWLAAAAALALATFGGLKMAGVWSPAPPAMVATAPAAGVDDAQAVAAELVQAEQHYQNAITGLERIADSEKGSLDPQTASTLEKNLAVVDQAINESRAALKTQPGSEPAQQSLLDNFKTKISLLQDTVALINEMRKGNEAGAARFVTGLKQKGR